MEYDLQRARRLASVLKDSIYSMHDRAKLAALTKHFLSVPHEKIIGSIYSDICWGSPFKLRPVKTVVKVRLPTLQVRETERTQELQRFKKIELQHQLEQQMEEALDTGVFLERRPLPPGGYYDRHTIISF